MLAIPSEVAVLVVRAINLALLVGCALELYDDNAKQTFIPKSIRFGRR
jgi:hypothetical protein